MLRLTALGHHLTFVAAAVGLPIAAFVCQLLVWTLIPPSPHLFFYPAVFAAARLRGAWAGYVATLVSSVLVAFRFLPPVHSLGVEVPRDLLELAIFAVVGVVMSAALGRLKAAVERERAARIAADETWSMIAHDLRTPLSSIELGATQLVRRLSRGGGDLERAARIIERSSARAHALLQSAVDAVKLGERALELAPGPCDVRELFARVVEDAASAATRAAVRVDTDVATSHAVVCDEPRIAQVLQNLLVNAIKATPAGGSVSLIADDDGPDVRITVRDTGRGIPSGELAAIFDKHWSKSGGSGLGLWIARGIVRAHGSDIDVVCPEAGGAAFSFRLPAMPDDRTR